MLVSPVTAILICSENAVEIAQVRINAITAQSVKLIMFKKVRAEGSDFLASLEDFVISSIISAITARAVITKKK